MDIVQQLADVTGHISKNELRALYRYAKELKTGNIVEIGSYQGLSTIAMAKGLQDGGCEGRIYAVDPHEPYVDVSDTNPKFKTEYGYHDMAQFLRNIIKYEVEDRIFPVALSSEVLFYSGSPFTCSLLFIDGKHDWDSVSDDYMNFRPFPEGLVLFHDSQWKDVQQFINGIVFEGNPQTEIIETVDSLTVVRYDATK